MSSDSAENAHVVIILASYNGEKFIHDQIRSIQGQSHRYWSLIIRDDGSSDNTVSIIQNYCDQDDRIRLIRDREPVRLGAVANFGWLLNHAMNTGAEYVAFSDQDDVWEEGKLKRQLQAMKRIEAHTGVNTPVLVHTDLEIVNELLERVHPSFMSYQGISAKRDPSLRSLLVQNCVTGCTMLINRSLMRLVIPIPDTVYMHDWWVALCAISCGVIESLPLATVRYRQHSGNIAGVGGIRRLIHVSAWRPTLKKMNRILGRSFLQAAALRERIDAYSKDPGYDAGYMNDSIQIINRWIALPDQAPAMRIIAALQEKLHSSNAVLTVLFYTQLIFMRRSQKVQGKYR